MTTTTRAYTPIRLDVTGFPGSQGIPSLAGPLNIAAWVFAPRQLPKVPTVLVCLPGGSYTKSYYHLEVPGEPQDAYSFALAMTQQGSIVVALDHLGVGESTTPADGRALTLSVVAAANSAAAELIRKRLQAGTLVAGLPALPEPVMVGIGHSMGAFLLLAQQALHRSFSAIALLGYTNGELHMAGMEHRLAESLGVAPGSTLEVMARLYEASPDGYITMDRSIAHALFHAADVPAAVIAADDALATTAPGGIAGDIARPGAMLALASEVDVPLMLANGELVDVSADFRAEPEGYPAATDITLYLLAKSAHCHNFAGNRASLWNRLARWIQALEPSGERG